MLTSSSLDLRQLFGDLRTRGAEYERHRADPAKKPFITVSRQIGAAGETLADALVERLNRMTHTSAYDPSTPLPVWRSYDRELVERVAKDHHISKELIESLEYCGQSWLQELLTAFSLSDSAGAGERAVVSRLATTIRELAEEGNVVLVGHGSVLMTYNIPAGIHIRVVAPHDDRVQWMMKHHHLDERHAEREIQILDDQSDAFFHRYWPNRKMSPELFHLALNSGRMDVEQMVDCVLPLVKPLLVHPSEAYR